MLSSYKYHPFVDRSPEKRIREGEGEGGGEVEGREGRAGRGGREKKRRRRRRRYQDQVACRLCS